jgi:eukaryotic-like serine/threonine-protein kinase
MRVRVAGSDMSAVAHSLEKLDSLPPRKAAATGGTLDSHGDGWSSVPPGGESSALASPPVVSVPEVPTGVREGEVVAGRYRIGKKLGSGAMGTVFAAHHLLLEQKLAIKFLVPEALGQSDAVARFVAEAQAPARLKSAHVVRVIDVAILDGGAPYIVMEYLEGCDLAAWLRVYGPLKAGVAIDFVLQACDAIAEAHGLGIIHRDIKPANLFAVQRLGHVETIKVLDFGISKNAGAVPSTLPPGEWRPPPVDTQEKTAIGTPCYMSPEQMESARDVDARTDIWSLGVTLCELVSGRLPFVGESLVQVYSTIKSGPRLRLRDTSPHVPRALEAIILKCLEVNRDRRYGSVNDLARSLVAFASSLGPSGGSTAGSEGGGVDSPAGPTPSPRVVTVPQAEGTLRSSGSLPPKPRRNVLALVGAGGLILSLVVGVTAIRPAARKGQPSLFGPAKYEAPRDVRSPVGQVPLVAAPIPPVDATHVAPTLAPLDDASARLPVRPTPVGSTPGAERWPVRPTPPWAAASVDAGLSAHREEGRWPLPPDVKTAASQDTLLLPDTHK